MVYSGPYSKPIKKRYIIGICFGWFIISVLADYFLFSKSVPGYTRLIALENAKFSLDPFYRNISQLSFTTFLFIPFLISILTIFILAIRKKIDHSEIPKYIINLLLSIASIFLAVILGHLIYRFISGIDWKPIKAITNFFEGYVMEGDIYLFTLYVAKVDSGLGAIFGLMVGIYFFYNKGVLKILIEKAGLDLS